MNKQRLLLQTPAPMIPPVPAILVTMNGMPGDPDEISVLWTFVVNGQPPQVGISADEKHRARKLVEAHGEFVLNVPVAGMANAFDTVDFHSSEVADKFALSHLTRGKAMRVNAPTVEESPIHVECRVIASLQLPATKKLFFAEVVATTVREDVCDRQGRLIVPAVPFFGMTPGSGEFYTMGKLVGHIGQSLGRTGIRY